LAKKLAARNLVVLHLRHVADAGGVSEGIAARVSRPRFVDGNKEVVVNLRWKAVVLVANAGARIVEQVLTKRLVGAPRNERELTKLVRAEGDVVL